MTPDHRPLFSRARGQDGFTLIELLVTIVILGVLAAVVVFSVRGVGDKGRGNAIAAEAATLRTAQESYCARHGQYGTVEDLRADGLLAGDPGYNAVAVGKGDKCGRGEKSSFTLYDASPTERGEEGIRVGGNPTDLAVDEKADRVYVVSQKDRTVTVIDGKTDQPIGSPISVSSAVSDPTRIAVNPGTGQVYVGGTGGVAIIDTANGDRVTGVSGFTGTVTGLAVSPENGDVYVGDATVGAATVAYIPAGSSSATPIALSGAALVGANVGMDFSFDAARHTVYFAKSGNGVGENSNIGLLAVSSQTHKARVVVDFPTKKTCGSPGDGLLAGSVRGTTVVDPHRNLVYLLARRCVPASADPEGPWTAVATTIAIDPVSGKSTPIDDLVGTPYGPNTAVYNAASGSVYVHANGGAHCGGPGGRVEQITGTKVMGRALVCAISPATGNYAHKIAALNDFNRVFVAQSGSASAFGGLVAIDGTTLLTQAPLGTPRQFGALAVNSTTAKVYAVDLTGGTVAVFRTGSA